MSSKRRPRCAYCDRKYGRRTFKEGNRYCSGPCAQAAQIERALIGDTIVITDSGNRITFHSESGKFEFVDNTLIHVGPDGGVKVITP